MADYFYPNITHTSAALALPAMARWLNGLDGVYTGPGWEVIASYSQYNSVGIDIPVAAPTVDALNADNSWRTGTNLTVGDWIILESGTGPTPWQVAIQWAGTNYPLFVLAPKGGFNVAGAVPTLLDAGNWTLPKLTANTIDMSYYGTSGQYTFISDGSYVWFKFYNGVNQDSMRSTYIGLTEDYSSSDPCPAVMYYATTYTMAAGNSGYATYSNNSWRRLSPYDETTEVEIGCTEYPNYWTDRLTNGVNYSKDTLENTWGLYPIKLGYPGQYQSGRLRGMYLGHKQLGFMGHGVLANKTYAWHKNYSADYAALVTKWDGTTTLGN